MTLMKSIFNLGFAVVQAQSGIFEAQNRKMNLSCPQPESKSTILVLLFFLYFLKVATRCENDCEEKNVVCIIECHGDQLCISDCSRKQDQKSSLEKSRLYTIII